MFHLVLGGDIVRAIRPKTEAHVQRCTSWDAVLEFRQPITVGQVYEYI